MSRFESQYEERYSASARLPEARVEIVTLRVEPIGTVPKYQRRAVDTSHDSEPLAAAEKPSREVYLSEDRPEVSVSVYDGRELRPGNTLDGPVIVDLQNTSVVAHEGQELSVNRYNGYTIDL